jgi:hypothetical protein
MVLKCLSLTEYACLFFDSIYIEWSLLREDNALFPPLEAVLVSLSREKGTREGTRETRSHVLPSG